MVPLFVYKGHYNLEGSKALGIIIGVTNGQCDEYR